MFRWASTLSAQREFAAVAQPSNTQGLRFATSLTCWLTVGQLTKLFKTSDRPEINREAIEEAMKLAAEALEWWAHEVGEAA